jgi:hypothetical protein
MLAVCGGVVGFACGLQLGASHGWLLGLVAVLAGIFIGFTLRSGWCWNGLKILSLAFLARFPAGVKSWRFSFAWRVLWF